MTRADAVETYRDFPGYERRAAPRALVIEKNAVCRKQSVALAIVFRNPVRIHFCDAVRRARIKRRRFFLGNFRDLAEHFGRRRLVKTRLDAGFSNRVQHPQGAKRVHVARIFWYVKGDTHMRLRAEIVNLIWLCFLEYPIERASIGEVPVMEFQLRVRFVWILIQVLNAFRIKRGASADDAVDFVSFFEQELGQIRPVLPRDAGDKRFFHARIYDYTTASCQGFLLARTQVKTVLTVFKWVLGTGVS